MKLQTELPHDTAIPAVKKIKLTDKNLVIFYTNNEQYKKYIMPRIPFTITPKRCLYLFAVLQQVDKEATVQGGYQKCQSS